jgi:5'-3' exonuclease
VYVKFKSKNRSITNCIKNFFNNINAIKQKYKIDKVFYVFDGTNFYKKTLDPQYKSNRNPVKVSKDIQAVRNIILNSPKSYLVYSDVLEADDMAFSLCKEYDQCICYSDDRDWILNLLVNNTTKILRMGKLLHYYNFEAIMGYDINKHSLVHFLKGDSKDGVKKPFRIKGTPESNTKEYSSIAEYCSKNEILEENVDLYKKLISPITHIPFDVMEGKTTEASRNIINHFGLKFDRLQRRKRAKARRRR